MAVGSHGVCAPSRTSLSLDAPHVIPYTDQLEASRKYRMSSVKFYGRQAFAAKQARYWPR